MNRSEPPLRPVDRRPSAALAVVGALAVALCACAERPADAGEEAGGIRLVETAVIRGETDRGAAGFGRIADLEIGADGSVFVLDGMNRTIEVFDGEGAHLRTFGRRGRGPGELERPVALTWGPDGGLWVVDPGNARYTVFDPEGDLIATYGHFAGGGESPMHVETVRFSPAGLLHMVAVTFAGGSLERPATVLIEAEVQGDRVSELSRTPLPFADEPAIFRHEAGGALLVQTIPFSSETVFRFDAGGRLWYARTREPWVHRWSPSSGVVQTVGRAFGPPPVSRSELRDVLEGEGIVELRRAADPRVFEEFRGMIPETKPHLQGFFLDDETNVWIVRSSRGGEDDPIVDVHSPSGTFVGSVRAPLRADPAPRVRGGSLAGVTRDELGVESVVLFRIEG